MKAALFHPKEKLDGHTEVEVLLATAFTEAIDDREVFMKGVDVSYAYGGCSYDFVN